MMAITLRIFFNDLFIISGHNNYSAAEQSWKIRLFGSKFQINWINSHNITNMEG